MIFYHMILEIPAYTFKCILVVEVFYDPPTAQVLRRKDGASILSLTRRAAFMYKIVNNIMSFLILSSNLRSAYIMIALRFKLALMT